jgi:hypothetical protein
VRNRNGARTKTHYLPAIRNRKPPNTESY